MDLLKDVLSRKKYYELLDKNELHQFLPNAVGDYEADGVLTIDYLTGVLDSRIENIGQNGNTGEHYDDIDYRIDGESYADKVTRFISDPHVVEVDDETLNKFNQSLDSVLEPSHYQLGIKNEYSNFIQAIDIIKDTLSPAEFIGYCKGNILKYQLRSAKKNKEEDLKKSDVYSGWLMEVIE